MLPITAPFITTKDLGYIHNHYSLIAFFTLQVHHEVLEDQASSLYGKICSLLEENAPFIMIKKKRIK
jgi:hypothetical protein